MTTVEGGLPTTELAESGTVRLIPTAYFKPPVLGALADTPDEVAALGQLEALTNRRLRGQSEGLPDLDSRELAFKARVRQLTDWGHTHINAAFLYTRPTGNRFNGPGRGAWYCAFSDLTAIEEVAYHRTRELGFAGVYRDEAVYQALLADFIGEFPDLRKSTETREELHEDPTIGYPAGQRLAATLREQGNGGLLYPSVRQPGGTCFAAFEPQIVQNLRPGARWLLEWDGSPDFKATANPMMPVA